MRISHEGLREYDKMRREGRFSSREECLLESLIEERAFAERLWEAIVDRCSTPDYVNPCHKCENTCAVYDAWCREGDTEL